MMSKKEFIEKMFQEGFVFVDSKAQKKFLTKICLKLYRGLIEGDGDFPYQIVFSLKELRRVNGLLKSYFAKKFRIEKFSIGKFLHKEAKNYRGMLEPRIVSGGVAIILHDEFLRWFTEPLNKLKDSFFDEYYTRRK